MSDLIDEMHSIKPRLKCRIIKINFNEQLIAGETSLSHLKKGQRVRRRF